MELLCQVDEGAPATLVADRQRIERILTNLLSNALNFTQRGRVTLRIGRAASAPSVGSVVSGPAVAFTVSDTGLGIPEAARERVFAPFEQVKGHPEGLIFRRRSP